MSIGARRERAAGAQKAASAKRESGGKNDGTRVIEL
jgi:hypothetical protein